MSISSQIDGRGIVILLVCVVALSRLVLGVHWPTDVLGAARIGTIVTLVFWVLPASARL